MRSTRGLAPKAAFASKLMAGSSGGASYRTAGALGSEAWLRARALTPPTMQRWHVEIALDIVDAPAPERFDDATASRFHLDIYSEEWGVFFCHAPRASWIRVTDVPFVHGRDDYQLLASIPALKDVGQLLRQLERAHQIQFQRQHASIRTNVASAEPAVRSWLATL